MTREFSNIAFDTKAFQNTTGTGFSGIRALQANAGSTLPQFLTNLEQAPS
jgi:hypothetical protein